MLSEVEMKAVHPMAYSNMIFSMELWVKYFSAALGRKVTVPEVEDAMRRIVDGFEAGESCE